MSTTTRVKKLATLAMLSTIAYVVMCFLRIPLWSFLSYDPKDVILIITGFIYGPLSACIVTVVVCVIEMINASDTGIIGMIMNILSSCCFACTAAFVYQRMHTKRGAVIGLITGITVMVPVMLLWNYLITPLYMEMTRENIAKMLLPIFLPFNLFKGGLNMAFTLLLYKPIITALRRTNLLPKAESGNSRSVSPGMILLALAIIGSITLIVLVNKNII